jgi:hypothetical protein
VNGQVNKMKSDGTREVAFRVAVKDGKVTLTARALRGLGEPGAPDGRPASQDN